MPRGLEIMGKTPLHISEYNLSLEFFKNTYSFEREKKRERK